MNNKNAALETVRIFETMGDNLDSHSYIIAKAYLEAINFIEHVAMHGKLPAEYLPFEQTVFEDISYLEENNKRYVDIYESARKFLEEQESEKK